MTNKNFHQSVDRQRRAGVLLHPTSLPGPFGNGDMGHEAYRFIEFLHECGFKVWQMLPLGPPHEDKSPYQCLSSYAGNPALISLNWLEDKEWLNRKKITIGKTENNYRRSCLQQACENFYQMNGDIDNIWNKKIVDFIQHHASWLNDYALYMALKSRNQNKPWYEWADAERHRDTETLDNARTELHNVIKQIFFEQFIFFTQWQEIRDYAKQYKIELFGDIPIFVALDSADVWAQRENFLIDSDGKMEFISGVPPDAFSETGQRWGNPLFNWDYMKKTNFIWWKNRVATQLKLFDMVRIDHFRGLQACWQIPQEDDTAIHGEWVKVPGREMLEVLYETFHHLPLVAEDLGVITDDVTELKNDFNLPGMKVMQFAFDGNNNNPHLPHRLEISDVVYTGTHDNDTTLGWVQNEKNYNKNYFEQYCGIEHESAEQGVWSMIRLAMTSVSFLCILPMQDVLMLDSKSRMNIPGTVGENWGWRFKWQQVPPKTTEHFIRLMALYQR